MSLFTTTHSIFNLKTPKSQAAFRCALSLVLAGLIATALNTPAPFWAAVSACMVSLSYVQASFQKSIWRIAGTLIGALIGMAAAYITGRQLVPAFAAMTFLITVGAYWARRSNYPYVIWMGAFTAILIIANVLFQNQNPLYVAYSRALEISLGAIIAVFCTATIFPQSAEAEFTKNLSHFLTFSYQMLDAIIDSTVTADNIHADLKQAKEYQIKNQSLLAFCSQLKNDPLKNPDTQTLNNLCQFFIDKLSYNETHLIFLKQFLQANPASSLVTLVRCWQHELLSFKNSLIYQKPLPEISWIHQAEEAIPLIYQEINQNAELNYKDKQRIFNVCGSLQDALQSFDALKDTSDHELKENKALTDRNNQLQYIQYAIKSGLSFLIAIVVWEKFGWPNGINGLATAFVMNYQSNLYDYQFSAKQKFIGCMLGGIAGVTALFFLNGFPLLLYSTLLLISWIFSYYMHAPIGKFNFFGTQANIALCIGIISPLTASQNFMLVMHRLAGIVFATMIILIVNKILWPIHPKKYVFAKIPQLWQEIKTLLQQKLIEANQHDINACLLTRLQIQTQLNDIELAMDSIRNLKGENHHFFFINHHYLKNLKQIFMLINLLEIANNPDPENTLLYEAYQKTNNEIMNCLSQLPTLYTNSMSFTLEPTQLQQLQDALKNFDQILQQNVGTTEPAQQKKFFKRLLWQERFYQALQGEM